MFPWQLSFLCVCVCGGIVCMIDWVPSSVYLFVFNKSGFLEGGRMKEWIQRFVFLNRLSLYTALF